MTVEIIQIDEHSAGLLNRVEMDVFDLAIDPDRVAEYVAETSHLMLVAVLDGVVVGQILAVVHKHPDKPTELYIDDLGVTPRLQRQGIATKMLRKMTALGKLRGCEEIWLATEPDNEPAKAFYKSLKLEARDTVVFEGGI